MMTSLLNWNVEPRFPLAEAEEDAWHFSEYEEKIIKIEDSNFGSLTKREIAQQLLNDIENIGKKDDYDAFSNWLEEKINVPIFDEIQPDHSNEKLYLGAREEVPDLVDDSLRDVDLTPPHGPERKKAEQFVILNLDGIQSLLSANESDVNFAEKVVDHSLSSIDYLLPPESKTFSHCMRPQHISHENNIVLARSGSVAEKDSFTAVPMPMSDLEREMAVVDEVIRSTAQRLEINFDCCESEVCSSSTSINSFGSLESLSAEDESDGSDWSPFPKKVPKKRGRASKNWRPYDQGRKQEDRLIRKKEQNKNAAVRYRLKKKAELSEILEEEKMLSEKKEKLEQKVSDIQMEIKYLKGLMRDLFRAKGLLIN